MTDGPKIDDEFPPQPELMAAAAELKRVRKAARITQAQMAETIGAKQSTISRIEHARQPITHHQIMAWYAACGYTLQAAAIGTQGKALQLANALEGVDEEGVGILVSLARAWPKLPQPTRNIIISVAAGIDEEYRARFVAEMGDDDEVEARDE